MPWHGRAFLGVAEIVFASKPAPTFGRIPKDLLGQVWERACSRRERLGPGSAPAHHIHMRNPDFKKLIADNLEPQPLIKRRRIHLRAEELFGLATLLGHANHGFHQLVANLQAAPVLEHRYAPDLAAGQQARSANRKIAFERQKMHGVGVVRVPLKFWWNRLFSDKHRFTNAPYLSDILLPVRDTYVNLIHRQIPGFLA